VRHLLEHLIARYGYFALAIGVLFEGEAVLIAAGALAHRGDLSLPVVVAIAFAASVVGDQGWFQFGRRYGGSYLARHPRVRSRAAVVERWATRHGDVFVLGFRFLYGLRTATPILLGAAKFAPRRFTVLNTIGAFLWASVFGVLGFAIGSTVTALLRRAARIEELILAAAVVALAIGALVSRDMAETDDDTLSATSDHAVTVALVAATVLAIARFVAGTLRGELYDADLALAVLFALVGVWLLGNQTREWIRTRRMRRADHR
jgi:membrane protein DedA with SNARE-associated domain